MPSELLDLARLALEAFTPERACEKSEKSEKSPSPAPLISLSSLISQPAASGSPRRCWTCGEAATSSFDDGSPRFGHGHDPVTGIRWTAPARSFRFGSVRVCPGCGSEHPVGTTCSARATGCEISERSEESPDLVRIARRVFGDDVVEAW